ncbi:MAG: DUF3857 domain-containing protein [Chitinophagaceae bacterium]|nr:DUF3857 domain-containing protein [Chitinophagaceae bacterium]
MRNLLLFLLLFICNSITAQKGASFGKIDKAEFEIKECEYDKTAAAEVLYDYGEINYFANAISFTNEMIVWRRIKIYSEKGLEEANIKIPFPTRGNRVTVSKISAYTYNMADNGEIERTELEKNAVYRQKVSDNYDEMVFSMPKVKAGSVFEFRYTISRRDVVQIDPWRFQDDIPVRYSKYDIGIPSVIGFSYRFIKRQAIDDRTEDGIVGVRRKVFVMANIPGLKKEPYMSSVKDYYQRVEFQITGYNGQPFESATWKGFSNFLLADEDFGLQLKKNVLKHLPLSSEIKSAAGPVDKVKKIYKYVQANTNWNGDNSFWCYAGVKDAAEKKPANSADINILLINLLRDAGIKAYPLVVSTREHGKINTGFPFQNQFDNVYAYVELDETGPLVLDATSKHTPFFISPWDVQFTNGFIADAQLPQIISVGDVTHKYKITTVVQTEIGSNGIAKGVIKNYAGEYAKIERLAALKKGMEDYKKEYFTEEHKDFTFESLEVTNEADDSVGLESSVRFKTELAKTGDYFLYSLNLATGLNSNPFLSEERNTAIEFGYLQAYTLTGNITIDESLVPEELPKNIKMIMPDSSIILQRILQYNGTTIAYRITLQINKPTYFSDEYPDFKEFYAAMLEQLNEQIVLKKKTNPRP